MDPLAPQAASSSGARPALALDGSLTAVLQEGRVVAGEVLQTLDGRSLLIAVGRHRVPAEAEVDLQPGERFLARVEKGEAGAVLRLLGRRGEAEPRLLLALRAHVGEERPIGELLGKLAARLEAALTADAQGSERLGELLQRLAGHVFRPGSSGEELARLLSRAGLDLEALLLAKSGQTGTGASLEAARAELAAELLRHLPLPLGPQEVERRRLLEQGVLDDLRFLEARAGTEQGEARLGSLARRLAARLAAGGSSGPSEAELASLLKEAGADLARLLGRHGGLALEAAELRANLKAELLAALRDLPPGEARAAAARALAGIESEQLLNLARREFHEGWLQSLPVPDGAGWTTARLLHHEHEEPGGSEGGSEDMRRVSLAVELSALGPLRVEVGVREDLLALRVAATRPEVVESLRAGGAELAERLARPGRELRFSVQLAPPAATELDGLGGDIRWLREHPLMDLRG